MKTSAVANEFAKMRHRHVGLVVATLLLSLTVATVFGVFILPSLDPNGPMVWQAIFANLGSVTCMTMPVLLAVLASRQVEMEHLGNGWLLSATSGVTPGLLCRTKFLATGSLVVAATLLTSLLLVTFGLALGGGASLPPVRWLAYTAALVVINLTVLALHILLSATIENQLVGLGIGIVGIFPGIFGTTLPVWVSHLTPWGYYALASQADYVDGELAYLDVSHLSIGGLAVVGGAAFLFVTGRFDHQEV